MLRLALLLLVLGACSSNQAVPGETAAPIAMQGWRTERGKVPTQAEFTAVVASCQDRKGSGSDLDTCLSDMGLRRDR